MKDLKVIYDSMSGDKQIEKEYDTIMDFVDEMESNSIDIPMLDDENVTATFFENDLRIEHFDTIKELLSYCKRILI